MNQLFLGLNALVIIPVGAPENFLNLKYSKLPPNQVELTQVVSMNVENSASPLFYKFDEPKIGKSITVKGKVEIDKPLKKELNDSYFQLGVIYAGGYRPGWIVRKILPEWLLKVIDLNKKFGLGGVDFLHVSGNGTDLKKTDWVRSIKLDFKTVINLDKSGNFEFTSELNSDKKILGLWLRADGDDHKGKFKTTIEKIQFID